MSNILFQNGIAISNRTGNRFIDLSYDVKAGAFTVEAQKKLAVVKPSTIITPTLWANWGVDGANNLPDLMVADIEKCGILNSIIDHQARFALGEGVLWAYCRRELTGKMIIEEICAEQEILDFMENNNHYFHELGWMKDQIGLGNAIARFILDAAKQNVALIQRDDVTEMRFKLMNKTTGLIDKIYLSTQWDILFAGIKEDDERLTPVTLLNPSNPLQSLNEKKDSADEFAYTFRYPAWGKKYYSPPLWYANRQWVKIAQSVPAMKAAIYNNSMRPKYLITVYREHWEQMFIGEGEGKKKSFEDYTEVEIISKKNQFYDSVDNFLVGAENAGKAIFVDGWTDPHTGHQYKYVEIESIDDTTKNGDYLPDSAAANSEIAFSMRYNPAIIGATMPSGPYTSSQGGSNVREAVSMQIITHEPERQNILLLYKLIRNFNNWNIKYAKAGLSLEPIIPTTMLSTLDTGAGTKPITTGGAAPTEAPAATTPPATTPPPVDKSKIFK